MPGTHTGPRWDAFRDADARDRRPAAPHQPAPGRDGHLDAPADRPRAGAARGDGRAADLPVGQGQLRRRRLPEDRPARARDALGGRGCDRPHRAAARRDDRPLADPARRPRRLRRDPGRRTRSASSRSRAARRCRACCSTRPENLDDLTVQVALVRPGPIQGKAVHPYIEHRQRLREDPSFEPPVEHESLREAAARHARRRRLPGPGARRRDGGRRLLDRRGGGAAARDEPQAQRGGDRGVPAALRRGLPRQRHRRGDGARRSTTSSSASRASASRSRTRPRSRCSPTSRPGCAATTRPSSSAR